MVVLLSIWHHLPFTFILLYTALLGIPRDLYEAAKVDGYAGADRWTEHHSATVARLEQLEAILISGAGILIVNFGSHNDTSSSKVRIKLSG